jgi:hypothetical protein
MATIVIRRQRAYNANRLHCNRERAMMPPITEGVGQRRKRWSTGS